MMPENEIRNLHEALTGVGGVLSADENRAAKNVITIYAKALEMVLKEKKAKGAV